MTIEVRYLHDSFGGDPDVPGPSPARLFQALVAGMEPRRTARHEAALSWLERQPPPTITMRKLGPDAERLTYGRSASVSDESSREAKDALIEHWRPWVETTEPGGAHVTYAWREDPPEEEAEALIDLIEAVDRLGTGIDHAYARYRPGRTAPDRRPDTVIWTPSVGRTRNGFRVPFPGLLKHLTEREASRRAAISYEPAARGRKVVMRIRPFALVPWREQGYERSPSATPPKTPTTRHWTVFELNEPQPPTEVCRLCGSLRHFAARAATATGLLSKDEITKRILGHRPKDGRACADDEWLSYWGLPSLAGPYPDGRIRRVMIAAPPGGDPTWKELIDALSRQLVGETLRGESGAEYAQLWPGHPEDSTVREYTGPNRSWTTATPALLRGGSARRKRGGSLRPDAPRVQRRLAQAVDAAARDFERSSGAAAAVETTRHGTATLPARQYGRKSHQERYLRTHLTVRTAGPVYGPAAIGRGTHGGFGLLVRSPRKPTTIP